MPIESLWVAELLISDRTAEKIRGRHHLDPDDIRDAVVCVEGRKLVDVVLYPAEHPLGDVYYLGSAYPL